MHGDWREWTSTCSEREHSIDRQQRRQSGGLAAAVWRGALALARPNTSIYGENTSASTRQQWFEWPTTPSGQDQMAPRLDRSRLRRVEALAPEPLVHVRIFRVRRPRALPPAVATRPRHHCRCRRTSVSWTPPSGRRRLCPPCRSSPTASGPSSVHHRPSYSPPPIRRC
eukprot:scaffold7226_cov115-Isochrysis_galbana.AAC.5